ncbi:hypothetical protein [Synechococcus sp. UW140]|uniref:hypothetical protein n=1 Tax=Synechococcus sp. UW140 TaxID=368503 RepID=UPI003137C35F
MDAKKGCSHGGKTRMMSKYAQSFCQRRTLPGVLALLMKNKSTRQGNNLYSKSFKAQPLSRIAISRR